MHALKPGWNESFLPESIEIGMWVFLNVWAVQFCMTVTAKPSPFCWCVDISLYHPTVMALMI